MQQLVFAGEAFQAARGHWPQLTELQDADPSLPRRDPWQHAFAAHGDEQTFQVDSAGVDGVLGTADDVQSYVVCAKPKAGTAGR